MYYTIAQMISNLHDDEVRNKLRSLLMDGKNFKESMEVLDISIGTFDAAYWRNTQGLRDFINDVKKEMFLKEAEKLSHEIMNTSHEDDARILAIKQKEAEFLRETLGKDIYSKKTEIDQQQPITINVNSLKDRLPEPIDTQPKALQSDVAQYTLSPQPQSGNTTPLIENDVKQLTDKE